MKTKIVFSWKVMRFMTCQMNDAHFGVLCLSAFGCGETVWELKIGLEVHETCCGSQFEEGGGLSS